MGLEKHEERGHTQWEARMESCCLVEYLVGYLGDALVGYLGDALAASCCAGYFVGCYAGYFAGFGNA
jgi:hypothetical protein